jgi:metal-responsive CopG/Arc/MetJ family transcriptional regulator
MLFAGGNMVRTQIQLTKEQVAQLKELAHEGNESIAAIIRKALDQYLAKQQPKHHTLYRQAMYVVGKYQAGVHDLSVNHDRYLEEEFGA